MHRVTADVTDRLWLRRMRADDESLLFNGNGRRATAAVKRVVLCVCSTLANQHPSPASSCNHGDVTSVVIFALFLNCSIAGSRCLRCCFTIESSVKRTRGMFLYITCRLHVDRRGLLLLCKFCVGLGSTIHPGSFEREAME